MNDCTKLMIDRAMGSVQKYSLSEADDAIRAYFYELLGVDEGCTRKEIRKAIRKNKVAIYEAIEETVEAMLVIGWGENPFFRQFVEERNINDGDVNEFYVEDDSVLTVSKFSGGNHNIIRQKLGLGESYSVKTSWYGVKIYEEFEIYLTKKLGWDKFINKLYEAWDNKINAMLTSAFLGLDTYVPAGFSHTGTLTLDQAVKMAEQVAAATQHDVMFVGTRSVLSKLMGLTPSGWESEDMKKQRNTLGKIAHFEGYTVMEIPQIYDRTLKKVTFPTDKLYILPITDEKPIKLVNEGDMIFNEVQDSTTNNDMTVTGELMAKLGVGTVIGVDFAVYTIS